MGEATRWLEALSPWPTDGFGLGRMRRLLAALGDPQEAFEAVHVVGTNGKSTAAITVEQLLLSAGLTVGANVSPHVRAWDERIRIDGRNADIERAVGRIRGAAEELEATQFEAVTAAALTAFADVGVDVAVVEAGLGGRHDATNVLRARVVLLTGVGLEHTDVLGSTLAEIAAEKLAVAHGHSIVVLSDNTYAHLVQGHRVVIGGAREAAEAFMGRAIDAEPEVRLPGRLELGRDEVRDGAHNLDGVRWLLKRLPAADYTVCASILRDKQVAAMLAALAGCGSRMVATRSSNERSLSAAALAELARPHFGLVEAVERPVDALARSHELGAPVLVTGSLYLLADLEASGAGLSRP